MAAHRRQRHVFFLSLLVAIGALTLFMFLPYAVTLTMATAFAVVLHPLYEALNRIVRGIRSIAAILTIVIAIILIAGPLTLIGLQVAHDAQRAYESIGLEQGSALAHVLVRAEALMRDIAPGYRPDFDAYARQGLAWLAANIGLLFTNTVGTALHLFLGIIAFFYLVKDGPSFVAAVRRVSPLSDDHEEMIVRRLKDAINSIVQGSLFIALLQGVLSGFGLWIFGVPSPALWGTLAGIGSFIPGVGTAVVLIPAVLFLALTGDTTAAVGLAIWGAIAVGMIDNLLGPTFVGRGVRIHPLLILFSVIGGVDFFGPLGFILGPLVLSLLFALLDIWMMLERESSQ